MQEYENFNITVDAQFVELKNEIANRVPGSLPTFAVDVASYYTKIHEAIYYAGQAHEKVKIAIINAELDNLIHFIQNIRGAAPDIGDFTAASVRFITELKQRFLLIDPDAHAAAVAAALPPVGADPAPVPGLAAALAVPPPVVGAALDPAAHAALGVPPVVDVVPAVAPVAGAVPVPPPAPVPARPVVVADPAVDRLPNDEFHRAIKSSVASFNADAKVEALEVLPNHDIHCKVKYPDVTNIKPITFKRKKGEHLSLTSEAPNIETRQEQARLLKDLPPKGPKTLKLAADTPAGFKELWKAMREADHHIIGLSHEQHEALAADATLAHLIERAGPSLS